VNQNSDDCGFAGDQDRQDPLHQQQTEFLREFPERGWRWCVKADTPHRSISLPLLALLRSGQLDMSPVTPKIKADNLEIVAVSLMNGRE